MSRALSVLVFLCSILSTGVVYAETWVQTSSSIEITQDQSVAQLENLDSKTDVLLDKAQAGTNTDTAQDIRIEQKQKEIEALINQAQEEIQDTTNRQEIKEIITETIKTIELKQSSALTDYDTLKEWLKEQGITNKTEVVKAEQVLKDAILDNTNITVQIKTTQSLEMVKTKLVPYDNNLKVTLLFNEDGLNYIELDISNTSLLKQEVFTAIGQGELPDSVLGYEIIKPEIFKIGDDSELSTLNSQWGIETENLRWWRSFGLWVLQESLATKVWITKIKIGIIDTGIEPYHTDLQKNISQNLGYDFVNDDSNPSDDQWHGTHVAGTIGGVANGQGTVGINPNVELVPLKICDAQWYCSNMAVLQAIMYAKQNNIKLLNMSLGGRTNPIWNAICEAIEDFVGNGGIVVAAAWNSNVDTSTFVPGWCPYAITVWAIDQTNTRTNFSNYGSKVDVSAPWVGIYSTYLGNTYKSLNGTSMSTPHIVGLISLLKWINNSLTTASIKQLFKQYTLAVVTDSTKPIASAVNVPELLASLGVTGAVNNTIETTNIATSWADISSWIAIIRSDTINTPFVADDIPVVSDVERAEQIRIASDDSVTQVDPEELMFIQTLDEDGITIQKQISFPELGQPLYELEMQWLPMDNRDNHLSLTSYNPDIAVGKFDYYNTHFEIYGYKEGTAKINMYSGNKYMDTYTVRVTKKPAEVAVILDKYTLSLQVWEIGYVSAKQWTAPFHANVWNNGVINARALSNLWQFEIEWKSPWTSVFRVYDDRSKYKEVVVTVTPRPINIKEIKASLSASYIQVAWTTELTITDGNGWYNVVERGSTLLQVSKKTIWNDAVWTIKWIKAGDANIKITDSQGKSKIMYIGVAQVSKELLLSAQSIGVISWSSAWLYVMQGNGLYSYTTSNSSILQVTTTNVGVWSIKWHKAGTASITITDKEGKTKTVPITITQSASPIIKELILSATSISILSGSTTTLRVLDSNGGYSFSYTNNAIHLSRNSAGTWIIIKWLREGIAHITVSDRQNKTKVVPVTVTYAAPVLAKELILSTNAITVISWVVAEFTILSGDSGYVVSFDSAVLQVTKKTSTSDLVWVVKWLKVGSTNVTVTDSKWKSKVITVTITPKPSTTPLAKITSFSFYIVVPDWWVGQGYFDATGLIMEAWIEYYDTTNPSQVYKQILDLQKNHKYSIFYNWTCADGSQTCRMALKPYVIDAAGNKSYLPNNFILLPFRQWVVINSVGEEEPQDETVEYVDSTPLILPDTIPQELIDKQALAMATAEAKAQTPGNSEGIGVEINALQNTKPIIIQWKEPVKYLDLDRLMVSNPARIDGSTDAISDWIEELKSTTLVANGSLQWYKTLWVETMNAINNTITTTDTKLQSLKLQIPTVYNFLYGMKTTTIPQLGLYDKQYYGSYLAMVVSMLLINPKWFNATNVLSTLQAKFTKITQSQVKVTIIREVPTSLEYAVWLLHFKIYGINASDLSEVGVQFTNGSGATERQSLDLEVDGEYMAGYSRVTCVWCTNFKPYYIKQWSTIASFGDIIEEGGLEIGDAVTDATIIAMNVAWINLDYDTKLKVQNKKVANVKRATAELASLTISLFPGVGEAYDIATLIAGKDPITREVLNPLTKLFTFVWLISGLWSWPAARIVWTEIVERIARTYSVEIADVFTVANDVAKKYPVNNVQDIKNLKNNFGWEKLEKEVGDGVKLQKAISTIKRSTVPKPDLSKIISIDLKKAVDEIYRESAVIWNKSTADAIRYTKATWILVWDSDHVIKWINSINRLDNILSREAATLANYEKQIINDIINDIQYALNGN